MVHPVEDKNGICSCQRLVVPTSELIQSVCINGGDLDLQEVTDPIYHHIFTPGDAFQHVLEMLLV